MDNCELVLILPPRLYRNAETLALARRNWPNAKIVEEQRLPETKG